MSVPDRARKRRDLPLGYLPTGDVTFLFSDIVFIAVVRQNGGRAARLFGAAEALREAAASPIVAIERPEYDAGSSGCASSSTKRPSRPHGPRDAR